MRPASVIRPSTSVTSAPYSSHSRMNGTFTSFGMKTFASSPAAAAYAAIALAALPADGTDSVVAPRCAARVTAADSPRALNELVGLSDSSLTNSRVEAESRAEPRAWISGVQPSPSVSGCLAVEERHQLAIPPHVRLAAGERLALPARAPRRGRSGRAGARRSVQRCCSTRGSYGPAPHGTLHSRWVK